MHFYLWLLGIIACTCHAAMKHWSNNTHVCRCDDPYLCTANGDCPRPYHCAVGWMGRKCQFGNAYTILNGSGLPSVLNDQNASSCTNNQYLEINLGMAIRVDYIHFLIKDQGRFRRDFQPSIQLIDSANKSFNFTARAKAVDGDSINYLRERGMRRFIKVIVSDISVFLCEVEISLGRNLALFGSAEQSSNFSTQYLPASLAVDGDYGTSSNTGRERKREWLSVILREDAYLNTIRIVNRDAFQCRMNLFDMDVFLNGISLSHFEDQSTQPRKFILVPMAAFLFPELVNKIKITIHESMKYASRCAGDANAYGYVSVVELEAYGYPHQCEDDMYGFDCDMECMNCSLGHCGLDGHCKDGCIAGFRSMSKSCQTLIPCNESTYGVDCAWDCGHCDSCDPADGHCISPCREGYEGRNCDQVYNSMSLFPWIILAIFILTLLCMIGGSTIYIVKKIRSESSMITVTPVNEVDIQSVQPEQLKEHDILSTTDHSIGTLLEADSEI